MDSLATTFASTLALRLSADDQRLIHYFVPAEHHATVLRAVLTVDEDYFKGHAMFTNWMHKLAQSVDQGQRKWQDLGVGEQQVLKMLRDGFPVTDPDEYVQALRCWHSADIASRALQPLREEAWVKGPIPREKIDDLQGIHHGRYLLYSRVFSKEEKEQHMAAYPELIAEIAGKAPVATSNAEPEDGDKAEVEYGHAPWPEWSIELGDYVVDGQPVSAEDEDEMEVEPEADAAHTGWSANLTMR